MFSVPYVYPLTAMKTAVMLQEILSMIHLIRSYYFERFRVTYYQQLTHASRAFFSVASNN